MIALLLALVVGTGGTASPGPSPIGSVSVPEPVADPSASPTPVAVLSGAILFRGDCTPGGGPGACRVRAALVLTSDGAAASIACPATDTGAAAMRAAIARRYFAIGTTFTLSVRGAPIGTFTVGAEDEPVHSCEARADGRRHGAPGGTWTFVATLPDDALKIAAIRFPGAVTPPPRPLIAAAFPKEISPSDVQPGEVRRLTDGDVAILVIDFDVPGRHGVVIAEGNGAESSAWKTAWSTLNDPGNSAWQLVDAFDLGADGHPDVLLEKPHRGEASEFRLLRRTADGWK